MEANQPPFLFINHSKPNINMENQIQKQEILIADISKTEKIRRFFQLGMTRTEIFKLEGLNANRGEIQNIFKKLYPERVKSRTNKIPVRYQIRRNGAIFGNVISTNIEAYLTKLSEEQNGNFTATKSKKQTIEISISELAKGKKSDTWKELTT